MNEILDEYKFTEWLKKRIDELTIENKLLHDELITNISKINALNEINRQQNIIIVGLKLENNVYKFSDIDKKKCLNKIGQQIDALMSKCDKELNI